MTTVIAAIIIGFGVPAIIILALAIIEDLANQEWARQPNGDHLQKLADAESDIRHLVRYRPSPDPTQQFVKTTDIEAA